jgi:hypothetical protein
MMLTAGMAATPYTQLWTMEARWPGPTAIAPWGDVVYELNGQIVLAAGDTGATLLRTAACRKPVAMAFDTDRRLVVACTSEVWEVVYPEGKARVLFRYGGEGADASAVVDAAIGGHRLVTASGTEVSVHDLTKPGAVVLQTLNVGQEALSVGIDAGGGRVVVAAKASAAWFDLGGPVQRLPVGKPIALSQDGKEVVGDGGSFVMARATLGGEGSIRLEKGAWLNGAVFLPGGAVLAGTSAGLGIFEGAGRPTQSLDADARWDGLSASGDGALICGANWSRVACFGTAPPAASQFVAIGGKPLPPPAPVDPAGSGAAQSSTATATSATASSVQGTVGSAASATPPSGTLASHSGSRATIRLAEGIAPPTVGAQQDLYIQVFPKLLGGRSSAWMSLATVKVTSVKDGVVSLEVLSSKASVTMNGEPMDLWTVGSAVRLDPP